jgi:hypothetical protein
MYLTKERSIDKSYSAENRNKRFHNIILLNKEPDSSSRSQTTHISGVSEKCADHS